MQVILDLNNGLTYEQLHHRAGFLKRYGLTKPKYNMLVSELASTWEVEWSIAERVLLGFPIHGEATIKGNWAEGEATVTSD